MYWDNSSCTSEFMCHMTSHTLPATTMPRKDAPVAGPISAQAQQDLVSEGIENFELPKSIVTKIAKSAVSSSISIHNRSYPSLRSQRTRSCRRTRYYPWSKGLQYLSTILVMCLCNIISKAERVLFTSCDASNFSLLTSFH